MASSKKLFLLLGILCGLVFLISSEVAASGQESMKGSGIQDADQGGGAGGGSRHSGGGGGGGSGGRGGGGGGGGGALIVPPCDCCGYPSRCFRCCGSAHEAPDAEFEDDVKH